MGKEEIVCEGSMKDEDRSDLYEKPCIEAEEIFKTFVMGCYHIFLQGGSCDSSPEN